jgi:hypothetical protein
MKSSGEYGSDSDAWPHDRAVPGRHSFNLIVSNFDGRR